MNIDKPAKVPQAKISSVDITDFSGGLFTSGDEIAPKSAITRSKDIEINSSGYIEPRRVIRPFLPDTVETTYQKYPVIWNGQIYYFTLDDGKAKFCQKGDSSWTDCDGSNSFTTNNGGMPTFLRALDTLLVINGKNGDRLARIDLTTTGFPVIKYTAIADPSNKPSISRGGGLSSGTQPIYYAISWNGPIGQTKLSPIETVTVASNQQRSFWPELSNPGFVTITRNNSHPTGATTWNLHIALAAPTGTIREEDMLLLAGGLDKDQTDFIDNGTLAINFGETAPSVNSTEGPRVEHGILADGRPVLYGDQDNPYNIWIGGGGIYALDFSINNGGYRSEPEKGTNYYPSAIVGFRTGQGQPALTVLYSNVEGLSKQAVLQQQTVNYGDISFTVWGVTEQHYGAAGVAAPYSAINYNGKLLFFSNDGIMSMETEATMQNVLSINSVSKKAIERFINSIKSSAMSQIVGTGWGNKYMWIVPSGGFDEPQQILVLDENNKGVEGRGAFYALNIKADWIGVVTPQDSSSFVYISQGNKTFVLDDMMATFDVVGGAYQGFSTEAVGPMIGFNSEAHNTWQATVQVMFNLMNLIGEVEIGVRYRNQDGSLKSASKKVQGSPFIPSSAGGWGDTQWTYGHAPIVPGYVYGVPVSSSGSNYQLSFKRVPIVIDDVVNEAQWYLSTQVGYNRYMLKSVSFEGISLGVLPDLA